MRVVPYVLIMAVGFGSTGCSLFKKRPFGGSGLSGSSAGAASPARSPETRDPILATTAGPKGKTKYGGVIAGKVIDERERAPRDAYIRWVCLEEGDQDQAPIDVAVGPDGHFIIRGLKPNKQYKLIARAKDGSRTLAAVKYIKAPAVSTLIMLKENAAIAKGEIPDIPGPPTLPEKRPVETAKTDETPKNEQPPAKQATSDRKWEATNNIGDRPPKVGIRRPEPLDDQRHIPPAPLIDSVPADTPSRGWVPGIAGNKRELPPILSIPGKKKEAPIEVRIQRPVPINAAPSTANDELPPPPPTTTPPPPPVPPPAPKLPAVRNHLQTRVPSCVLVGKKLINFALYDTNGQVWEYKKDRRGKLVLLDFWATWCMPCRKGVPELAKLQAKYGKYGLEVIGIASEREPTFQQQAQKLATESRKLGANYRQLLSGSPNRPVVSQFRVTGLPTLVLIDQNGNVVWRESGFLTPYKRRGLELHIESRLGLRR